eukprot:524989_1
MIQKHNSITNKPSGDNYPTNISTKTLPPLASVAIVPLPSPPLTSTDAISISYEGNPTTTSSIRETSDDFYLGAYISANTQAPTTDSTRCSEFGPIFNTQSSVTAVPSLIHILITSSSKSNGSNDSQIIKDSYNSFSAYIDMDGLEEINLNEFKCSQHAVYTSFNEIFFITAIMVLLMSLVYHTINKAKVITVWLVILLCFNGCQSECISPVALGFAHSCALLNTGSIKCWGGNGKGQLGQFTNICIRMN